MIENLILNYHVINMELKMLIEFEILSILNVFLRI